MKLERSNIDFPLWRKKVDSSLFKTKETPIPKWLFPVWRIDEIFYNVRSSKDNASKVRIFLKGKEYFGNVTFRDYSSRQQAKLTLDSGLVDVLKDIYLMSYMRSIEEDLRKKNAKEGISIEPIEDELVFWEFLDIEFNAFERVFYLTAHYVHKPDFHFLFRELVKSHILKRIDQKISCNESETIIKGQWKHRDNLHFEMDALNVIYYLLNSITKQIYIGEARSFKNRVSIDRHEIPGWDYYRYDVLPETFTDRQRLQIEILMIRVFASFFPNMKNVSCMNVSEYLLANKKIELK